MDHARLTAGSLLWTFTTVFVAFTMYVVGKRSDHCVAIRVDLYESLLRVLSGIAPRTGTERVSNSS